MKRHSFVKFLAATCSLLALVIAGIAPSAAQAAASVSFACNLGGSARYGIISGTTLYALIGSRLYVSDATDIANPVQIGSLALPGIGRRISIQGSTLYIACTEGGLVIVDVADPANPRQLSALTFDTAGQICKTFDAVARGSYAYVADHTGFHAVDISNPAAPVVETSFTSFDNARHLAYDVYLDNNTAFLCCEGDGLYIFDISNPAQPQKISSWKDSANNIGQFYMSVRDGNYLYIAGGIAGLVVLDISNLQSPQYVSNYVGPEGWGGPLGVVKIGNYCYLQDEFFNMHIMDVSDVTDLSEPASVSLDGHHSLGIWNEGSRIVLANSTFGIRIFDAEGTAVTQRGFFRSPGRIMDAEGAGAYAYIAAGQNGLYVYDMTDPASPGLSANLELAGYANGLCVAGSRVYVAELAGGEDEKIEGGMLEIIDVTSPASPAKLGSVELEGEPYDVTIADNIAYVSLQTKGLAIVDVSDPAAPEVLSAYDTAGICYNAAVWGPFVIGSDGLNGCTILDVRDTSYPKKVVEGLDVGSIQNLAVWETYLILAGGADGLSIADLTQPFAPSVVQTISPLAERSQTGQIKASAAFNSYVLLAESYGLGTIRLFDIIDPANPVELEGEEYLVGDPIRVSYSPQQGLAYVCSQIAGLYIYEVVVTDEPQINVDGRWIGAGTAADTPVGIALELDQAHAAVFGTVIIADPRIRQGSLDAAIVDNQTIIGLINFEDGATAACELTYNTDGTVSGTFGKDTAAAAEASLTYVGSRGLLMLEDSTAALAAAIDEHAAESPALQQPFLNIADRALASSLASTTLSSALKNAAVAEAALRLPRLIGPIAVASEYLYPAAYWEILIAQAISQNMVDGICADYRLWLQFMDSLGDTALAAGTFAARLGNQAGALCQFGSAARFYESVASSYQQYMPQCPGFGVAAFDGYYEGAIDFSIVLAKLSMCVDQAEDGTVTGEAFIVVEASGEFLSGTLVDCKNTSDGESVLTGTIEVQVGEITAHILIEDWKYNTSSRRWEGTVTVVEQKVSGNVSIARTGDECPEGWNTL
jgi:hypothetical protein